MTGIKFAGVCPAARCKPASKLDQISGRTCVEVGPGITRELIERIGRLNHPGVVNSERQLLLQAGRRLTLRTSQRAAICNAATVLDGFRNNFGDGRQLANPPNRFVQRALECGPFIVRAFAEFVDASPM